MNRKRKTNTPAVSSPKSPLSDQDHIPHSAIPPDPDLGVITHDVIVKPSVSSHPLCYKGGCRLFTRSIPIYGHYTLLLFFLFSFLLFLAHADNPSQYLTMVCSFNVLIWVHVLLHECGHIWAGKLVGAFPTRVILWPLGGIAPLDLAVLDESGNNDQQNGVNKSRVTQRFYIALGGPLVHVPLALFWFLVSFICWVAIDGDSKFDENPYATVADYFAFVVYQPYFKYLFINFTHMAMVINVWLFLLNVGLPLYPADGGKIFVNLLRQAGVSVTNTAILYIAVNAVVGIGLFVYSIMFLKFGPGSFLILYVIYECVKMGVLLKHSREMQHPVMVN